MLWGNMIKLIILMLVIYCEVLCAIYLYDDDDTTVKPKFGMNEDLEFEPAVPKRMKEKETPPTKNLSCDDFHSYADNCTMQAAMIYNSSQKSPPMPAKILDWCRAIRHLTNCAIDWNSECKDVTDTHFNEESIKGHMHVVNNVCDDEWYLSRYDELPMCLDRVANAWENCYVTFKKAVDLMKNSSQEWTHYETHFHLCCARTHFRRCTLEVTFDNDYTNCVKEQALTLQKFSVIVSEGDVFQNCDTNILYKNCPGGDPRPSGDVLARLMNGDESKMYPDKSVGNKIGPNDQKTESNSSIRKHASCLNVYIIIWVILLNCFH